MRGAHCDEGNGKTVLARFGNFAAPSTLWESGHFYFASTDSAQYVDSVYTLRYNTMVADGIEFDWDAGNREHLADHKVTAREFEAVMQNSPLDLAYEVVGGEERYRAVGMTDSGRLLVAIWTIRDGKVRAVTAFPAGAPYRKLFPGRKR
jgi:uncharacterized DUF497 family protein